MFSPKNQEEEKLNDNNNHETQSNFTLSRYDENLFHNRNRNQSYDGNHNRIIRNQSHDPHRNQDYDENLFHNRNRNQSYDRHRNQSHNRHRNQSHDRNRNQSYDENHNRIMRNQSNDRNRHQSYDRNINQSHNHNYNNRNTHSSRKNNIERPIRTKFIQRASIPNSFVIYPCTYINIQQINFNKFIRLYQSIGQKFRMG